NVSLNNTPKAFFSPSQNNSFFGGWIMVAQKPAGAIIPHSTQNDILRSPHQRIPTAVTPLL
ncbi:MAG: hypothetical protein IJX13_08240, partial [Clostridia bacterium]|nr:hypothetical protein [Clostridia bacterium]